MSWQAEYVTRYYRQRADWIDGTEEFHRLCASVVNGGARILEIGAGPTNPTSVFLATLGRLHGLDPDPAVFDNTALSSASILRGDSFDLPDESFDCCVSNYVAEHVSNPLAHLTEVRRVLKPGGAYVFRTVNRFHYVALGSSLTPHWIHTKVANKMRDLPVGAHDPYPTTYALNTAGTIRRLAEQAGFRVREMRLVEKEPTYGQFAKIAFLVFMAYERLVNSSPIFSRLRANLFVVLERD